MQSTQPELGLGAAQFGIRSEPCIHRASFEGEGGFRSDELCTHQLHRFRIGAVVLDCRTVLSPYVVHPCLVRHIRLSNVYDDLDCRARQAVGGTQSKRWTQLIHSPTRPQDHDSSRTTPAYDVQTSTNGSDRVHGAHA